MKKFFIYFCSFIFICFILPALLTKLEVPANSNNDEKVDENDTIDSDIEKYSYNKYATIKLLHTNTNEIEEVPLDEYLCNVVSAEMPADFEKEALKAQAIVARTYTIYKINNKKHDNADICDDSKCCQAWISKEDRLNKWSEQKEEKWKKIEECV